jgi:glycosyltransferase involved in cell wall biosynthesis
MHILLIHQAIALLDEPGGTRHHEFARHLVSLGHRVTIITGQVSYLTGHTTVDGGFIQRTTDNVGVSIVRSYCLPGWHRSFIQRVLSSLSFIISSCIAGFQVRNVDLVWGTSPPIFQGLTAILLARMKHVPFLFEVRDLWPYFAVSIGVLRQPLLIRLSEWLERFLYSQADSVIVNSPGFIDHVLTRGAREVKLISNGVDTSMFDPKADGADFRRMNDLEGRYIVLYAGAHGMANDLEVVLEAADKVRDLNDVVFLFLGDGKEKPFLKSKAEALGLTNVQFLSPVPKEDMSQVLAAANACVAILKPIEAFKTTYPNKVFDYMAAGRPVLLAIDGVIREKVETAGAGIFVPPGNPEALAKAVRRLVNDRDQGERMGQAGRAYVEEHFDRKILARKMEQLFSAALMKESANTGGR